MYCYIYLIINVIKMYLKILESNIGSSVLGTHKSRNSLKIKSCGIFHSIFVNQLSAKV